MSSCLQQFSWNVRHEYGSDDILNGRSTAQLPFVEVKIHRYWFRLKTIGFPLNRVVQIWTKWLGSHAIEIRRNGVVVYLWCVSSPHMLRQRLGPLNNDTALFANWMCHRRPVSARWAALVIVDVERCFPIELISSIVSLDLLWSNSQRLNRCDINNIFIFLRENCVIRPRATNANCDDCLRVCALAQISLSSKSFRTKCNIVNLNIYYVFAHNGWATTHTQRCGGCATNKYDKKHSPSENQIMIQLLFFPFCWAIICVSAQTHTACEWDGNGSAKYFFVAE